MVGLPGIGPACRTLALSRLAWSMHLTMNAGMELRRALRLSLRSTQNLVYVDQAPVIDDQILAGNSLQDSFRNAGGYPPEFLDTLAVAEESGRVVEAMGTLSRQSHERAKGAIAFLTMVAGWAVWAPDHRDYRVDDLRVGSFYINQIDGLVDSTNRSSYGSRATEPPVRIQRRMTLSGQLQIEGQLPKMQKRLFLVTGGAGFIGSNIAEALVRRGDRVRVLDNLSMGHLSNMESFREQIEFIEETSPPTPPRWLRRLPGWIASPLKTALASVPLSVERPLDSNAACVTGTVTVLDAARRAACGRVVYAASSAAYGDQPTCSKRESDLPAPLSPYAAAKLAGELYCRAFFETFAMETVAIRYFNVFGPRQDPNSPYSAVIPLFITKMLSGEQPVIYGDGRQSRDFSFVGNVVHANLLAADRQRGGPSDQRRRRPLDRSSDSAPFAESPAGAECRAEASRRAGDVRESQADIARRAACWATSPRSILRMACSDRSNTIGRSWDGNATRTWSRKRLRGQWQGLGRRARMPRLNSRTTGRLC